MSIWAWIGESCHAFRRDTCISMYTYICVHSVWETERGCIEIPRTRMEESCHAFRWDTYISIYTYICVYIVCMCVREMVSRNPTNSNGGVLSCNATKHPLLPLALTRCYIHIHLCICICPPASVNHVKIFKGWPPRDAPSKLVQLWYQTFLPDQRGQVAMKTPTRLSNKTGTAQSCAEDQIPENKNLRNMILNFCTEG